MRSTYIHTLNGFSSYSYRVSRERPAFRNYIHEKRGCPRLIKSSSVANFEFHRDGDGCVCVSMGAEKRHSQTNLA